MVWVKKMANASETLAKDIEFLRNNLSGGEKIVYESIVANDMSTTDISLIAGIPSQMTLTILRRLESRGFVEYRRVSHGNLWSKKNLRKLIEFQPKIATKMLTTLEV